MINDMEISQKAEIWPIKKIGEKAGLSEAELELYGFDKAKIKLNAEHQQKKLGKLILVTAISPTPAGEGKTTVTIGLSDALNSINCRSIVTLREPSMGPVMGMKGGATGGGYSQIVPMEDINLHFTGDFHAVTSAHNTLAALIDNSIQHDNPFNIDPRKILWKRVLDVNDRALRHIIIGLGGSKSGIPREDGFDITAASELMAILTLSTSLMDLKSRIKRIVIAYNINNKPVTVDDLGVAGVLTVMLKDAIKPNLVQTLEHTPALIHGGPFANIAQGTNSILATKTALKLADYVVTEAGFGSDLGGEKFLDIKVPILGKHPDSIVLVATIRALKYNGGQSLNDLKEINLAALEIGLLNLEQHINAMKRYNIPVVVAINRFINDSEVELNKVKNFVKEHKVKVVVVNVWEQGSVGAIELAETIVSVIKNKSDSFLPLYKEETSLKDKIKKIVTEIYGGLDYELSDKAQKQLQQFEEYGWDKMPIVMAKTQYSLSDNPKLLGRPKNFKIYIRELVPKLGAGFIVALTGSILTMPGMPDLPAANRIDIDENGVISGLD